MIKLSEKIEIIIPQNDNNGNAINNAKISQAIMNITQTLGGCTVSENLGYWVSDQTGALMIDKNLNYEWYAEAINYADDKNSDVINNLMDIIHELITEHDQEGISVKYNDVLYILDHGYKVAAIFDNKISIL